MRRLSQELHIREIKAHRKENCIHYETCLTEASALLWPSFSCKGCQNYCRRAGATIMSYERASTPLAWEA